MATITKFMADKIKNQDGYYSDDPRVLRITEYTDMGGKLAYGIEYREPLGRYIPSPYVRNPRVYWEAR